MKNFALMVNMVVIVVLLGCAKPQDYLTEEKGQEFKESVRQNEDKYPLIGIWQSSYGGIEARIAVNLYSQGEEKLKAVVLNGDEVGFAFYNGHPWFYVSPSAKEGIYVGKACYQNIYGIEYWFPTKIVLSGSDEFTMYDDVGGILVYGGTVHNYIRTEKLKHKSKILPNSPESSKGNTTKIVKNGTGFFITEDGYILTASHVVEDVSEVQIVWNNQFYPAKVILADRSMDVAVLKVEGKEFPALPLAGSSVIKTGDEVFTVGFPQINLQGKEAKYTNGSISSLSGIEDNPRYFQISIPVQPGNSGGPLVSSKGQVVGIVVARLSDVNTLLTTGMLPQNVNYALKSSFVLPFLESVPALLEKIGKLEFDDKSAAIEKTRQAVMVVVGYE